MPITLYDSNPRDEKTGKAHYSITAGTVTNNSDCNVVGKVAVRIPALDQEVVARIAAPGAGGGRGLFSTPNVDDEVLVALNDNDPDDAFVIGGLWSAQSQPPVSGANEVATKRVLRTGRDSKLGHMIEFDDGDAQTITISVSASDQGAKQTITMKPGGIELANQAGTLKITMDNDSATISIRGAAIAIGDDDTTSIRLHAGRIEIGSSPQTSDVTIQGQMVQIN